MATIPKSGSTNSFISTASGYSSTTAGSGSGSGSESGNVKPVKLVNNPKWLSLANQPGYNELRKEALRNKFKEGIVKPGLFGGLFGSMFGKKTQGGLGRRRSRKARKTRHRKTRRR
jgi:hypothetical protein